MKIDDVRLKAAQRMGRMELGYWGAFSGDGKIISVGKTAPEARANARGEGCAGTLRVSPIVIRVVEVRDGKSV